jgi:hypothetical protein
MAQLTGIGFLGALWPFFVLGPGAVFLYYAITGDSSKAGLAVPGAMITGTGAILFYQNLTGHWTSWAYIWALYPVFLGLALVFVGRRTHNERTLHTGDGFVKWGLLGFIGLWALFELFIFGGNSQLITVLVPLALIAAGVVLLTRNRTSNKPKSPVAEKPKNVNGHRESHSETLQKQIDTALSEGDEII